MPSARWYGKKRSKFVRETCYYIFLGCEIALHHAVNNLNKIVFDKQVTIVLKVEDVNGINSVLPHFTSMFSYQMITKASVSTMGP